jgi:hypothetical protein
MMAKLLLRLLLGITVLSALLVGAGTLLGRGVDTPLAAALISPQGDNTFDHTKIAAFDLQRRLRIEFALPVIPEAEVLQVNFHESLPGQVMFATYDSNTETKRYQANLYLYDYLTQNLTTVAAVESDRPFHYATGGSGNRLFYDYSPFVSHDGLQIAYINPANEKPYVFDRRTNQTSLLADIELYLGSTLWVIAWSPDDTKISLKDEAIVRIVSAPKDGGQPVEIQQLDYPTTRANFLLAWSADSRSMILFRWIMETPTSNSPLIILDVADGSEHPFVQKVNAHWGDWACDQRWLYYIVGSTEQNEGYLLNLQTGETLRVNDASVLADVSVNDLRPTANCDQFLIGSEWILATGGQYSAQDLYVFDVATQTAALVDENILTYQLQDETLYYIKRDPVTGQHPRLSRNLNPLGEIVPLNGIFPITALWRDEDGITTFDYFDGRRASEWPGGELGILDLQTQSLTMLTGVDEMVIDHQRYRLSEVQDLP